MTWVNIIDFIYPVGIIIEFTDESDPSILIGGKWTRLTDTSPYRWERTA